MTESIKPMTLVLRGFTGNFAQLPRILPKGSTFPNEELARILSPGLPLTRTIFLQSRHGFTPMVSFLPQGL